MGNVTGPKIMFEIPIFGGIPVTETVTNSWIIMAVIVAVCIYLSSGLKKVPTGKTNVFCAETADGGYIDTEIATWVFSPKFNCIMQALEGGKGG